MKLDGVFNANVANVSCKSISRHSPEQGIHLDARRCHDVCNNSCKYLKGKTSLAMAYNVATLITDFDFMMAGWYTLDAVV